MKVVIIGAGGMAEYHRKGFLDAGADVVAICDTNGEKAEAYAKAHGIEAELIEDTVQTPLLAVLAEITGKEPDVVGLSVHIWNKNYVYSLIRLLRKVMPQLKIIASFV